MARGGEGGFGIGSLIFAAWIGYLIFGGDSDNKEKKVEKPKEESAVVETVKEHTKTIKEETKKLIEDAKESLGPEVAKITNELKEAIKEEKEKIKTAEKEEKKEDKQSDLQDLNKQEKFDITTLKEL